MSSVDSVSIVGAVWASCWIEDSLLGLGLFLVDTYPVFCLFEIVATKKCLDFTFLSSSDKPPPKRYTDTKTSNL